MQSYRSLADFDRYLYSQAAKTSTIATYVQRLRPVLAAIDWPGEGVPACVDLEAVDAFVGTLPASSAVQTRSAWNCFAAWCRSQGAPVPGFARGARASLAIREPAVVPARGEATPLPSLLPSAVQSAVWDLAARHSGLLPPVIAAARWEHMQVVTGTVDEPQMVRLRHPAGGTDCTFKPPFAWWRVLRAHAAPKGNPQPGQPLVPAVPGGSKPVDLDIIADIRKRGRKGLVPLLVEDRARSVPLPPPLPPNGW